RSGVSQGMAPFTTVVSVDAASGGGAGGPPNGHQVLLIQYEIERRLLSGPAARPPVRAGPGPSDGAVLRGRRAVEHVAADVLDLPADRVVQGVGAGVAPVPVQVVPLQAGSGARQLEQRAGDLHAGPVGDRLGG